MMFNQHAALNMARLVHGQLLREADRERLGAEYRRHHSENPPGGIRRLLGTAMVRAGERMQGLPRREADALPAAHWSRA